MDTETRESILDDIRSQVVEEAKSWYGTPFHHKGRKKGVGVDCGGFIYEVYSKFVILPPFPRDYAQDWALHQHKEIYLDWLSQICKEVKHPKPGDVVLFQVGRNFSHATLFMGRGRVIHAWGRNHNGGVKYSSLAGWLTNGERARPKKVFTLREDQYHRIRRT